MAEPASGMPAPQNETNLRECEDQSWFKVQAFIFFFLLMQDVFGWSRGYSHPRLKTTEIEVRCCLLAYSRIRISSDPKLEEVCKKNNLRGL
jgi:hypothetical protein